MEAAVRARTTAKIWVTRQGNNILDILDGKAVTKEDYLVELEDFHKRVTVLQKAQAEVEALLDPDKVEEDIATEDAYNKEHVKKVLAATRRPLIAEGDEEEPEKLGSSGSNSHSTPEARLPKLTLPKFGGEVQEWLPFWEQFDAVIDRREDLPVVTKFSYLKDTLIGEAKRAIAGLSLTGANYQTACDILKERFGRTNKIIFAHIQALLGVAVPDRPSVEALWILYGDLQTHIRSLDSLGITGRQYGVILTPLILSRLPELLRLEWAREGEREAEGAKQTAKAEGGDISQLVSWEADLNFLMDFLKREIQRRETSQTYSEDGQLDATTSPAAAASLHIASSGVGQPSTSRRPPTSGRPPSSCGLCYRERHTHSTIECPSINGISTPEKKDRLVAASICLKCLTKSTPAAPHDFKSCKSKCAHCKGPHNTFLCMSKSKKQSHSGMQNQRKSNSDSAISSSDSDTQVKSSQVTMTNSSSYHSDVLLQIIKVSVSGRSGKRRNILALFDSGSDRTYVSQKLVNSISPEYVESQMLSSAAFGDKSPSVVKKRDVYNLLLEGEEGAYTLNATCVPNICAPLSQPSVPSDLLAKIPTSGSVSVPAGGNLSVDLLIGMDNYWKLLGSEVMVLSASLVAHHTRLGWMVSGMLPSSEVSSAPQSEECSGGIDTGGGQMNDASQ